MIISSNVLFTLFNKYKLNPNNQDGDGKNVVVHFNNKEYLLQTHSPNQFQRPRYVHFKTQIVEIPRRDFIQDYQGDKKYEHLLRY